LQAAIDSGNAKIVATLLQRGADANAAGGDGETPLQQASTAGETRIVELLEQAGAAE
jgi:ankyrin repeat protein